MVPADRNVRRCHNNNGANLEHPALKNRDAVYFGLLVSIKLIEILSVSILCVI